MQKNKRSLKIFISIIGVTWFIYSVYAYIQEYYIVEGDLEIVSKRNFKGIENLQLIGTINSVQEVHNKWQGYGGIGIIWIDIVESNINDYDPREKQANYYCIIKNGKAEIYGWWPSDVKKGDTLLLDVRNRTMIYPAENGSDFEIKDFWIPYVNFFKYIKEQGYQQL